MARIRLLLAAAMVAATMTAAGAAAAAPAECTAKIGEWFARLTRSLGQAGGTAAVSHGNLLYQYTLGAWMIAAGGLGFSVGFMQMVTTGRDLITKADAAAMRMEMEKATTTVTTAAAEVMAASKAAEAAANGVGKPSEIRGHPTETSP